MDVVPKRARSALLGSIVATVLFTALPGLYAQELTTVDVSGPTVIAFFRHVTEEELEKDADTNEALSDFQLYVAQVREPMQRAGIDFNVISARSFRVRIGKRTTVFQSGQTGVGYYFIAPGRKPRVEYGVMTDTDLMKAAQEYFKFK